MWIKIREENNCSERIIFYLHKTNNEITLSIRLGREINSAIYYVNRQPIFWKEFTTDKITNVKRYFSSISR